jgi:tripartite-type tricarboxylate transporter receptor subunit TctC
MGPTRTLWAALASLAVITSVEAASAGEWPSREIVVVAPFAAGTTNETVARMELDPTGSEIRQSFIVQNRPGEGGTFGVASVVKASPDGYTLLLATSALSSAVILHKSLPYDTLRDFAPVAMFGRRAEHADGSARKRL